MRAIHLLPAALAFAVTLQTYGQEPQPLTLSGDYPVTHDPSIARQGDTYYVFATTSNADEGQFPVRCLHDLLEWKKCGFIFDKIPAWIAERTAALEMLDAVVAPLAERAPDLQVTLGADTQYQEAKFIEALRTREIAPHVSEYVKGNLDKNSLNAAEKADPRRAISQRKRKLVERAFVWSKLDRPARQVKLRGLERVDWFWKLSIAAHNLMRMRKLIPIETGAV
jgi:hypothetical protein